MLNSFTREQQTSTIIAKRQTLAYKLNTTRQQLLSLKSAIELMDQQREEILGSIDNETIRIRLTSIELDSLKKDISAQIETVSRYYSRFVRKTLNIGVLGLARQGKSQLLRSLTGLSDDAIPASPYGHCTGARSTIIHNPTVEAHGEVYFYTQHEFVRDILAPYYKDLFGLSAENLTLEWFEANPLPALSAEKQQSLNLKVKYERLELYKSRLPEYKALLSQPSPHYVPIGKIREYVAQDNSFGQQVFSNYLAVREARIICSFPHKHIGQIALVDMPGLGDTGQVGEGWLTSTISNDVDIILFVKKPSGLGDVWKPQEIDLYDKVRSTLPELPLEMWTFLVMNHVRSSSPNEDNLRNCERLLAEKSDQMKFVGSIIADCSDAEQVNDVILQKILDHLTRSIEKIDHAYLNSLQDRLNILQGQVDAELVKAKDLLLLATESTPPNFTVFNRLFRDVSRRLYTGFEEQIKKLRDQRERPNETFYEYVVNAQEKSYQDSGVPSIDQIEDTRNLLGGYKSASEYYLNHIRTYLALHFESLEDGLNKAVEDIKLKLVDVLRSEGQGRLRHISSNTDTEFLKDLAILLNSQYPTLYSAFRILSNFQLSYQGFLYYRLRNHLDCLTPDSGNAELGPKPSAVEVQDILVAMQKMALESLKGEVEHWPVEINQAIFAIGEQFVDKVLRSENALEEWQSFYMENRAQIWPEHFQQLTISNRLHRQWLEVTERVISINRSILLVESEIDN
ncbi:hypothetical protein [Spirosoma linguale]|uniref:Dynamin family protein n=1 Tax=Spirosoma linguale (strain ATCC 33905 / DSM 74 / LMG 10896 / Claus 1) TaxID=504472 RepID=D2QHJ7_SPILD|nr:hypothetical protein Slin_2641 [Spirosoma linguale DSM 74]